VVWSREVIFCHHWLLAALSVFRALLSLSTTQASRLLLLLSQIFISPLSLSLSPLSLHSSSSSVILSSSNLSSFYFPRPLLRNISSAKEFTISLCCSLQSVTGSLFCCDQIFSFPLFYILSLKSIFLFERGFCDILRYSID